MEKKDRYWCRCRIGVGIVDISSANVGIAVCLADVSIFVGLVQRGEELKINCIGIGIADIGVGIANVGVGFVLSVRCSPDVFGLNNNIIASLVGSRCWSRRYRCRYRCFFL